MNSIEERDDDCSTGVRRVGRTDAHYRAGGGPLAASRQWRGVRSRCCTGGASARIPNQEQGTDAPRPPAPLRLADLTLDARGRRAWRGGCRNRTGRPSVAPGKEIARYGHI